MNSNFHTNLEVVTLAGATPATTGVTKVGILPFMAGADGELQFMVMKPRAESRTLGEPAFQIAKGTRRINVNGDWCDMRDDDLLNAHESFFESLLQTALREGQEEVGLKSSNIRRLFDAGRFTFISASRKTIKPLHMFAAEIVSETDFLPYEASTAEVRWITAEAFAACGREDHTTIASKIVAMLQSVV